MTDQLSDPHLDAALHCLREQTTLLAAPRAVEDALMAAFAEQQRKEKKARWWHRIAVPAWHSGIGLAGLGAAVLAVMLVLAVPPRLPQLPAMAQASEDDDGAFIAIASAEHIALEPAPQLIETEIARTALAGLGVSLSPDNAGDLVRAQVLVGADGQPLALRLLTATPAFHHSPERG
jgi:hypothetical protein